MSDFPKFVTINEEGPREGIQIEKKPIPTARKIELIEALSNTGLKQIQTVSFVNPQRVPSMADAADVVAGFTPREGVRYTALWLNDKGLLRALGFAPKLHIRGSISLTASEPFLLKNQQRTLVENEQAQHRMVGLFHENGVTVDRGSIMAAFGCNYQGDVTPDNVLAQIATILRIAEAKDCTIKQVSLADTMGWATPEKIKQTVGAVRSRYPELKIALHLHDTRGMGIANAYAGLQMGVDTFDACVAGLGGCPFAANAGAAGNVCTEDLAFMLAEQGIETGLDLDALIECAKLAEDIFGRSLPGAVKVGGNLAKMRQHISTAQ